MRLAKGIQRLGPAETLGISTNAAKSSPGLKPTGGRAQAAPLCAVEAAFDEGKSGLSLRLMSRRLVGHPSSDTLDTRNDSIPAALATCARL